MLIGPAETIEERVGVQEGSVRDHYDGDNAGTAYPCERMVFVQILAVRFI